MIVEDGVMHALAPVMRECSEFIKKNILQGRQVVLKYNDDVDGICAALSIFNALKEFASQNRVRLKIAAEQTSSPFYEKSEVIKDLSYNRPLVILCDYAANEESIANLELAKASGASIVIVDHHPPSKKISEVIDFFISPFAKKGNSDYSTGLLALELARMISRNIDEELALYALQGDKSTLASKKFFLEPIAIDLVASTIERENSLNEFNKLIQDKKRVNEYFEEAMSRVKRVLEKSKSATKAKQVEGVIIAAIKLDKLCKKNEYPQKGKCLNFIHDEQCKQFDAVVSIGYGSEYISLRISEKAFEKGVKASKLINYLKEELGYALLSGGGHEQASAIRVKRGFTQKAVEKLVEAIEEELNKRALLS